MAIDPRQDRTSIAPRRAEAAEPVTGPKTILVIANGTSTAHALPAAGKWLIGRGASADLQILEPGVSRRQALLHLGPRLYIQDLGSANGTRLAGVELRGGAPVELLPGQAVEIGPALLVVPAGSDGDAAGATDRGSPPLEYHAPVIAWGEGSASMRDLNRTIDRVAPGDINVLVLGETGVGKDVVAREIHRRSRRASGPFLRVNCATLSEQLLESELFGHERGAFTGAIQAKPGLFQAAGGGTVFLDEVGELPLSLQAKLLVALEERRARRVGGMREYPIDVRFVSATNRDLGSERERRNFRADLYFRLNGVSLVVPPLRERPEEIPALANHFLRAAARLSGRIEDRRLSDTALAALHAWPWPGNIRELRNVIERAVLLTSGPTITREHLRLDHDRRPSQRLPVATAAPEPPPRPEVPASLMDDPRRKEIVAALERFVGNQSRAAQFLGISRNTLFARMRKYRIPRPRASS